MKYSVLEMEEMRDIVDELYGTYQPLRSEGIMRTYMLNGTTVEELREIRDDRQRMLHERRTARLRNSLPLYGRR